MRDAFPNRHPAAFEVEGWNAVAGESEFIQAFTDNTLNSVERFAVASNKPYAGLRLMITESQKGDKIIKFDKYMILLTYFYLPWCSIKS